jgi:hypothetical protein
MIKSRRMSLVEHVAYMEEKMCIQVLVWGTWKKAITCNTTHRSYNVLQPSYLLRNVLCSICVFLLCTKEQTSSHHFACPLSGNIYCVGCIRQTSKYLL